MRRRRPAFNHYRSRAPGPSRTLRAVLARFREGGYPLVEPDGDWEIRRTNAGHWQRSAGAWSWFLEWRGDGAKREAVLYGGYWPARECGRRGAKASTEASGNVSLDPPGK